MSKLLIKGGTAVFADKCEVCDILVDGKKIVKIAKNVEEKGAKVIDAKGLHVFPGLIDLHVHLREPGFEYKEDIASGSAAAVRGGFSQVCCMPNTDPVCDNAAVVGYIVARGREVNLCKVRPIGAITKGEKGEQLAEIGKMKEAGAIAISDDGRPVANARIMRLAMEYASDFGLICLSHCEDKDLVDGGVVNEGYNSTLAGLKGIPRAAEEIMLAREIILAETLGKRAHICHVSTKGGVQLLREAKKRGVAITAETCPHYFTLTDDVIMSFDANTKVNPPIREAEDVEAIKEGLKDGTLDCIVTDHAPHHKDEKNVEYNLAAFGISGIETSFSLSYTYLVKAGVLTLEQLADRMSTAPARILGLEGGALAEGAVADIMLADLNAKYVIDSKEFVSKGKNTPFNGTEVYGKVCCTIVDGDVKYRA
ncbi:MAG TPA: dihydroorotase [Candidatus Gallimonas intestinavium]|uniref:Dihydroorotase n=1 Tax=Candidatus Gallimonas intestinavium TaxID=2838603 RepID=A0A9D2G6L0_9FIRM|nr:dihydroorotase [Candidatus Gallimonas intestinavium]